MAEIDNYEAVCQIIGLRCRLREQANALIELIGWIHVPSDLLGFTVVQYENQRTDRNFMAAVGPFRSQDQGSHRSTGTFQRHVNRQVE